MSRFWAAGGSSDSDSDDSDDSSSIYSSDEDGGGGAGGGANQNRWVDVSDSDDDSEDEARVVKSGKERALESFQKHIKSIRGAMKLRDYYAAQTEFDELAKSMVKAKQYLAAGVPRQVVRILVDLEDWVQTCLQDKEQFKKLSARQSRALNRMKLTLKKHNKAYSVVMKAYRANPVESDDEDSSDSDSDDDSDDKDSSDDSDDSDSDDSSSESKSSKSSDSDSDDDSDKKKKTKKAAAADSDSDDSESEDSDSDEDKDGEGGGDSDSDWASDSSSSSSEDEKGGDYSELKGRAKWLKKNTVVRPKKASIANKDDPAAAARKKKGANKAAAGTAADALTATKSILPEEGLTAAVLNRRVREIAAKTGRRSVDHRQQLRHLEALARLAVRFGPRIEIPVLMYVISAQFGLQRTLDDYMDTATWKSCAAYLSRIACVLERGYTLGVQDLDESDMVLGAVGGAGAMASVAGGGAAGATASKMSAAANAADGAMAAVAADEKLVNPHTGESETADERAERLRVEREAEMTEEELKVIPVVGSLALHIQRLEEEYTKSLQKISHHSAEYIVRLRDESKLVELLERFQVYLERVNAAAEASSLAQLRIEHLYYRHDSIAKRVDQAAAFYETFGEAGMFHPSCIMLSDQKPDQVDYAAIHPGAVCGKPALGSDMMQKNDNVNFESVMTDLCKYVYKHGTEQAKTRATICQVYHHALHDRFTEARDLLLMSHLQENIYHLAGQEHLSTMVLFNRMMVTIGMCAFRLGRIVDAHSCLSEVCSGRIRELLAQGVNTGRFSDKSAEQEKAEKRRQVPYHQHINMDLLEACHLISAMLLEVPNMAQAAVDGDVGSTYSRRSRVISRSFRKFYDQYNHQVFTGPPEQTRDFVMRASKALLKGDWKTCADLVTQLDVWQLVPGQGAAEDICKMLTAKIKLEGLRTFLFAFSAQYDSLSLSQLCGMFEMSKNDVHSVVSKMMIHRELYASWDQPTETIVLRRVEPTSLQVMALQFAEKAASLVEANERLLDSQSGGSFGYKDDWKGGGGGDWGQGGGRGRGGGRGGGGGYRGGGGGYRSGGGGGGRGGGGGGYRSGGRGRGGGDWQGKGGNYNNRGRGGGGGNYRSGGRGGGGRGGGGYKGGGGGGRGGSGGQYGQRTNQGGGGDRNWGGQRRY